MVRPALFSCWTGLNKLDAGCGIIPPPPMGKLVGALRLIRCWGTRPRLWPPDDGDVGDIEGVVEFELLQEFGEVLLWLIAPRPDPGRAERSQALYCSPPRPLPGLESLEKAGLGSDMMFHWFLQDFSSMPHFLSCMVVWCQSPNQMASLSLLIKSSIPSTTSATMTSAKTASVVPMHIVDK